ncbi:PorP/SprF family type IX secretion system membrane protein [Pseudozobellia thermophila]|uniref:Type IX secretion system membrane protein, PorP/SprF family n=1 Tax=Pseudozobellia thermophila TaxID=192903 RepID=A0A1M6F7Z9_9FLAO|nr:PorP/SprF family type IX secretion system membrane protein [Pseudozobellia thermophila]SHI93810.1 type IX secretion system membrane protein, PorP/SprF family [Pseudozobellia thermophila]
MLTKFSLKKYVKELVFVFLCMLRTLPLLIILSFSLLAYGQKEERLPADLRQHNLTTYNASLFNPAFSFDRNNAESVAFWSRWQWQAIDGDPTTVFLNYTRKLNGRSAAGLAFFQQNTGVFFNTGGALNYAYQFQFNELVRLSVGLNVFAFQQELADDRFQTDPNLPLPLTSTVGTDFIVQMAPGVNISVERLSLSLASENLIDYNFNEKEGNTAKEDKIFMSLLSYDFPLMLGSATNAFLRPSMYLRTIPGQSNQVGFYTLLNTDKYWGQVGYNNFYGYGIGAGATFFKHLSLGALVELGTGASITKDTSFELMAAYLLGKPDQRNKVVGFDLESDTDIVMELNPDGQKKTAEVEVPEKAEESAQTDKEEAKQAKKVAKIEEKERRKREKFVRDSIARVEKEAALAAKALQKEQDREAKKIAKEAQGKDEEAREAELLARKQQEQARQLDSINKAREERALAEARSLAEKRKQDSIAKVEAARRLAERAKQQEADKPKQGEKYEEVQTEDGLEPGYYLIANVFGTKKYFEAFMSDLRSKGMDPGFFVRSKNNYHYAYLGRFDTMQAARAARDSNFGGKYTGKTWIFRVVGK